jgi:AraC-like DNA-binding protein
MTNDDVVRYWSLNPQRPSEIVSAFLQAGQPMPHVHEEWQFAVPEIPAKLSLGAFRRFTARACDVTVIHPYDVHTEDGATSSAPRWRALYVAPHVVNRLYRELIGGVEGAEPRFPRPVVDDPTAALELRLLLQAGWRGTITASDFLTGIQEWLLRLLRRHAVNAAAGGARLPAVERARAYLQERPTEAVSLPEVRAVAGVTTCHLVRSFSRAVGLPPKRYHAQVRLARAHQLLAEEKPATWVAYECGFADQAHLSRRFKETHGLTPRAFQAHVRGTADAA